VGGKDERRKREGKERLKERESITEKL